MATQQQINGLITKISTANQPASVTNEMVGQVLDHLNKGAVNQATDARDAMTLATIAKNQIDALEPTVEQLDGRLGSVVDTLQALPKFLPVDGQLTQEQLEDGTAPDGVWLVPNPDEEGTWWFQSFGNADWHGYDEENYNADMEYMPGNFYIWEEHLAVIENGKLTKIGSHEAGNDPDVLVTPGMFVLSNGGVLLVSRYAKRNTNTYAYFQLIADGEGLKSRTGSAPRPNIIGRDPSEVEWDEWEDFGGGVAEGAELHNIKIYNSEIENVTIFDENGDTVLAPNPADNGKMVLYNCTLDSSVKGANGAIVTDASVDTLYEPNVYLVNGKDTIVVSKTVDPLTHQNVTSQIRISGTDIKTRRMDGSAWTSWENLTSVAQAKTLAEEAGAAAATAQDTAEAAQSAANAVHNDLMNITQQVSYDINSNYKLATDGVFIMYFTKSGAWPALVAPEGWLPLRNQGEVAVGVLLIQGDIKLLISPNFTDDGNMVFYSKSLNANEVPAIVDRHEAMISSYGDGFTANLTSFGVDAAVACCNYGVFSANGIALGKGQWWLPSLAELLVIYGNKKRINEALSYIDGAELLTNQWLHSSTTYSNNKVWMLRISDARIVVTDYTDHAYARPVSTYLQSKNN